MGITAGDFLETLRAMGVDVRIRSHAFVLTFNSKQAYIDPPDPFRVLPIQEIRYIIGNLGLDKLRVYMDFPDLFGKPSKPKPPDPPG